RGAPRRARVTNARHLLVVFHSRSGATRAMADSVVEGASSDEIDGVDVRVRHALDAGSDDVRWCHAVVLGTPENFGSMSGLMKDFLERIFYVVLDETPGLPYALFVKAGTDGEGAIRSIERILTGLRWRAALPAVVVTGDLSDVALERCRELGLTMAA